MFLSLIAGVIVILIIISYMSTSSIVSDASQVKMNFEKVKFVFPVEKVIVDSVENLCQKDPVACKNKDVSGTITLTFNDLVGYIPDTFVNENLLQGTFTNIQIVNNYTTVRVTQTIPDDKARKIYLNHYVGREYSIPPKCVAGTTDTTPPCSTTEVYHDYPTSLETRSALE